MGIKYLLLVNKQGQTRLSKYYDHMDNDRRVNLEGEIIRKCLGRSESQVRFASDLRSVLSHQGGKCLFVEFQNYKVVYRRYASLYFILGVDSEENELAMLELIHFIVETFDKYFSNVCELDIMFNIDKGHMLIDEVIMNGHIVETNQRNILSPIGLLDSTINNKD